MNRPVLHYMTPVSHIYLPTNPLESSFLENISKSFHVCINSIINVLLVLLLGKKKSTEEYQISCANETMSSPFLNYDTRVCVCVVVFFGVLCAKAPLVRILFSPAETALTV